MRNIVLATVPGKKDDPNYAAVRGHVPVELYKKFKIFCLERGIDNSEGLEELLREYFDDNQPPPASSTSAKGTGGKSRGKGGEE